jgi:hypothetical protein
MFGPSPMGRRRAAHENISQLASRREACAHYLDATLPPAHLVPIALTANNAWPTVRLRSVTLRAYDTA